MKVDLGLSLRYYKNPEVQELLVAAAANKEIGTRFGDKFGKRPDVLLYPNDVMQLARQGISSFHCSEETWHNPLDIQTGMQRKDLDPLRSGWDLVLDIDCAIMEYSRICADLTIRFLKYCGVKDISCKFSGNKGFHIAVPFESFPKNIGEQETRLLFPEVARKIAFYIKENIKDELGKQILAFEDNNFSRVRERVEMEQDKIIYYEITEFGDKIAKLDVEPFLEIDTVLISSRHLYRMPYSLHEKSGLMSLPINPGDVLKFEKPMADPNKFLSPIAPWLDRNVEESARRLLVQAFDFEATAKEHKDRVEELKEASKKSFDMDMKIESAVQPELFPPCMQKMLEGMEDGKKRAVFAAILFLGKLGWTKKEIQDFLLKWNREKNPEPLRENYIIGQLRYFDGGKKLPPNCDNVAYYTGIAICHPDGLCKKIKNPVNYSIIKLRIKREQDKRDEEQKAKEERKALREAKNEAKFAENMLPELPENEENSENKEKVT